MRTPRIFVVGAGNVGATSAAVMVRKQLGAITLYDVIDDLAVGKAMDINQTSPFFNSDSRVTGSNSIRDMEGADIVICAAGFPRKAGMNRLDLLNANLDIARSVGEKVMDICPGSRVLVVSNPVDVLTTFLKRTWPGMNVFGLGCSLDALRFRFFIAEALGVSVDSASGIVIGMHNDVMMIPLVKQATVGGILVRQLMPGAMIEKIVMRTREAGTAIVEKLKDRSGFYAAANTIAQVVESMVSNKKGVFPLSVWCDGEYGRRDICLALPAIVGHDGVERIVNIALDDEDTAALGACADQIEEVVRNIRMCAD